MSQRHLSVVKYERSSFLIVFTILALQEWLAWWDTCDLMARWIKVQSGERDVRSTLEN